MFDSSLRRLERVVTTYDVTWLLDLHKNNQLNLSPKYQRKSVWTPRDRRFFMDTIFRNYPSPAIFLHKTIDDSTGNTTYHVVDGKQRILTILLYVQNKFALASDFGDESFDGKRWSDFANEPAIKRLLWNYRITIEELDDTSFPDINDVFSRLNKNASKLTRQELRHARFDGWLITFLEEEAQADFWKQMKVRTAAKEKRMLDVQNLSELASVVISHDISGFSQDDLDQLYAEHDEPLSEESEFDTDEFRETFARARETFSQLEAHGNVVTRYAQPFLNFYTLWAAVVRNPLEEQDIPDTAARYSQFMEAVSRLTLEEETSDDDTSGAPTLTGLNSYEQSVRVYKEASSGATTDGPKRRERLEIIETLIFRSQDPDDEN